MSEKTDELFRKLDVKAVLTEQFGENEIVVWNLIDEAVGPTQDAKVVAPHPLEKFLVGLRESETEYAFEFRDVLD